MKKNRQMKILEIIEQNPISTQEDLINRLKEEGYTATQATVSRDIRSMKLIKTMSPSGVYRYAQTPQESADALNSDEYKAYAESIVNVDYSMNNVVVKTKPGMASAVAFLIDRKAHRLVLGTVAGDDTIIIVTHSTEESETLSHTIRNYQKTVEK